MKKSILLVLICLLSLTTKIYGIVPSDYIKPSVVTPEGAWCWFADPRALHYENADGSINSTYIGIHVAFAEIIHISVSAHGACHPLIANRTSVSICISFSNISQPLASNLSPLT